MAMASLQRVEFEEAITCPVCLARYDENVKKPKYLVSCCHTLCISCLEVQYNYYSYSMLKLSSNLIYIDNNFVSTEDLCKFWYVEPCSMSYMSWPDDLFCWYRKSSYKSRQIVSFKIGAASKEQRVVCFLNEGIFL